MDFQKYSSTTGPMCNFASIQWNKSGDDYILKRNWFKIKMVSQDSKQATGKLNLWAQSHLGL